MNVKHIAATAIARARDFESKSAAEFDYMISTQGVGGPNGPLGNQVFLLANEHLPEDSVERAAQRDANHLALWAELQPELQAYEQRCRERSYTGWSNASRGPIRYAS